MPSLERTPMSSSFDELGVTAADVQTLLSTELHRTILLVFCYAIHTCIYFNALYHIVEGKDRMNIRRIFFACVITFLWGTHTVVVGILWRIADDLFIVHGQSRETELAYYMSEGEGAGEGDLASVMVTVLRGINVLVADAVLIGRSWMLYDRHDHRWKIRIALATCLFTEIGSACAILALDARLTNIKLAEVNWILVHYSITIVTNGLCTFLIVHRIVSVGGWAKSLKTYRGIIELLVESALAYSIIYLVLVILYGLDLYSGKWYKLSYRYPWTLVNSITGIAPTLIIARVMAGKLRPNDSWTRPSLPHIRTNMRSLAESLRFASGPNRPHGHTTTTFADMDLEAAGETFSTEDSERGREGEGDVRENEALRETTPSVPKPCHSKEKEKEKEKDVIGGS